MLAYHIKRYLYISPTHFLLPHIQIDAMSYHKIGTNDNLVYNIGNNEDVAYTDVGYSHLHPVFPLTVAYSLMAVRSLTFRSSSRFPLTTSGLMTDRVAPVSIVKVCCLPFMLSHADRLFLLCCITDMKIVGQ